MASSEECTGISNHVKELIHNYGYPLEVHSVTTEDGYINMLYRIPHGKHHDSLSAQPKTPLLFVHGLLSSCAEAVNAENGLGYFMADAGYDVWLANCRGTTFSRGHVSLDCYKNKKDYWDFSWHEIGYYDLPAFIDYILRVTDFTKLLYIGHSQGVTSLIVLTSSKPEYNEKLILCCALAPTVVFTGATLFPAKLCSHLLLACQTVLRFLQINISQLPLTGISRKLFQHSSNKFMRKLSLLYLFMVAGQADEEQASTIDFKGIGVTTVNTASWKQVIHYCQVITGDTLRAYNFGKSRNMELYGSELPLEYDLSKVTAPFALFYGKNDEFYHTKDIDTLSEKLGNVVYKYSPSWDLFNHIDFVYAKDNVELLYNYILACIEKYN